MNALWIILITVVCCSASLVAYDYSDDYDNDDYDYDYSQYTSDESNDDTPLHSKYDNISITDLAQMMFSIVNEPRDVYLTISTVKTSSLKRSAFLEGKNIKRLYFKYATIDNIEDEAFLNLRNLEHLFLRGTNLKVLSKRAFSGLNKLQSLDLSNNLISELDANIFNDTTSLIDIHLHNNLLKEIDPSTFLNLHALEKLDLYNNFLMKLDIKLLSEKISSINFSNNTIAKIEFSIVPAAYDVSHNKLTSLTKKMFGSNCENKKLRFLYLSHNNITFIEEGLLESFTYLVSVNLANNFIEELTDKAFSVIYDIDFTFNKIKTISNITIRNNCIKFDVSHNAIVEFNGLHAPNLTQLFLNNNKLVGKLAEGKFTELNSLSVLRLDNNKINDFSRGTFIGLENLFSLDISHNAIKNLNNEIFYPMERLEILNIRGNQLRTLDLPTLKTNIRPLTTILIAHNPWNCNELVPMLHYMNTKDIQYLRAADDTPHLIQCKEDDVINRINQENVTGNDAEIIHNEIIRGLIEEEITDMSPKAGEEEDFHSTSLVVYICVLVLLVACVGVGVFYLVYKKLLRSRQVAVDTYEIIDQHGVH